MNIVTKEGLSHFWDKLKDKLNSKVDKYIDQKLYENDYFYNSTTNGNCTGYDREFATVLANEYNTPFCVRLLIEAELNYNGTIYTQRSEAFIGVTGATGTTWVHNFNVTENTSYSAFTYITIYRPATSVKAETNPFRLVFRSGSASSKTAYPRKYKVTLLEQINCNVTLNETLDNQAYQKWAYNDTTKAYFDGTTFRTTNFDCQTNGLQETGDADSYACYIHNNYFRGYVSNKLRHYSIFAETIDGKYESITTSVADNTTQDKVASTTKFRLGKLYYFADSTTRNADYLLASSVYLQYHSIDFRYTANITTTGLTSYAPVYIIGNYDSETDSFTVDTSIWTHTLPTEDDGKIYILLGYAYTNYSGNKDYRLTLRFYNTVYYYKDGGIKIFNPPNSHTHSQYLTSVSWDDIGGKPTFFSGDYNDLSNKPTNVSAFTNDSGYTTATGHNHDSRYYTESEIDNKLNSKANLSGATFTGDVIINSPHRDTYYASNLCRLQTTSTPTEFVIKTKIKYVGSTHMPVVRIYGYAYGLNSPIELRVGFYIYGGNLGWAGVSCTGAWKPDVYLFKYTEDGIDYVAIGFMGSCYFCGFQVDAQIGSLGSFGNNFSIDGWSTTHNGADTTKSIIPAIATDNCIKVNYKPMATDISGSAGSVAWNNVTGKPSFFSGNYNDLTNKPTIPSAYTLPKASATTLGGIKVGNNLTIDENGVLSAVGGSGGGISINDVYPVGSVYFSVNNTNPATLFGGTWVSVGNNLKISSTDYFWGGIEIYAWKRTQ